MEAPRPLFDLTKLSHWLGISDNGLLLYAREKIIPDGDHGGNGLGISDCGKLFQSRILTGFGFTIKEATGMMRQCDFESQHQTLDEMECAMQDELVSLAERLRCLHQWQGLLREFHADPDACCIVPAPDLYFLPIHDQDLHASDAQDHCAQWLSQAPYIIPTIMAQPGGSQAWYGASANLRDIRRLALPTDHAISLAQRSELYLRGFLRYPSESFITPQLCTRLLEAARNKGYQVTGPLFSRHLLCERVDDIWQYCAEVYLPVSKQA